MRGARRAHSETEYCLQIDAANGHTSGERSALKTVVFVEERGPQNSARIAQVDLVEYVARGSSQCEAVTAIGIAAQLKLGPPPNSGPRGPPPPRALRPGRRWAGCLRHLQLRTKPESLAEPHIEGDARWAGFRIDRGKLFARRRRSIEGSQSRAINVCGAAVGSRRKQTRPVVELRVAVQIIAGCDVEGRTGTTPP